MARSDTSLTTREFAQQAGVSSGTVSKWLRQGTIQGEKINGKWSISAAELIKVTQTPGSPPPTSKHPNSKADASPPEAATGSRSFSIEEFSRMTYLTPFGVQKWIREGRLKTAPDSEGRPGITASNLDNPDIKRLLR